MSIWKGKKTKLPDVVLSKEEERDLLRQIINDFKKDLVSAVVQEFIYQKEVVDPVHIGRQQAESNVAEYQKRIRFIKENIQAIRMYAEDHSIMYVEDNSIAP